MGSEECGHCGREFDDEEAYLHHLQDEHGDDLGPIERRRVAALESDDGRSVAVYAGIVGVALAFGLLAYLLFSAGGGLGGTDGTGASADAATTPHDVWSVHYHGTITVEIGGEELDFSRSRFQMQADPFHFENGEGDRWHGHARDVTLEYAMGTLGIEVSEDEVTYDGTTYRDGEGARVVVEVNGEPVTPAEYVLEEGDEIRIVAEETG